MWYFFGPCLFLAVLFFFVSGLFRKLKGAEKKPMSDNSAPQTKHDVFVSFRGQEIRQGFLSHLTAAFKRKQINAFVDDELERGEKIWAPLVGAIERSSISLILFSRDYASSRWCLEELVKILECREKYGRIVIPVFYHVQPADVRHQRGSYKSAFAKHARKYKSKVQIWRHAMSESADLSGIDSSSYSTDAEVLEAIVDLLLSKLAEPLVNSKGLVGINEKIADVESLIRNRKEPKDICLVGICGMGGIGKTTLAEEIFYKLQSEHEGSCFLANEREQSSKRGIISLKNEIFSNLLGDVKINTERSLPNEIVRRIGRMKVLIVLDDVNDSDHLQALLGTLDNFGSGSRIIVTTRDERVLNANKADEIYRLTELSFNEALELFKLIAFHQSDHQREYDVLSKRMVHYAKGVPLVLKVLAHRLREKNKEIWKSELDKLEKMPPKEVYEVMKMSYDDLDRKEQQIFLDLACFVLRLHRKVNVGNLKSLLKDGESDNSVVAVLERLKDKALITFCEDNFICMHDSLHEMGLEIVRRQSRKRPARASWLWDPNDICQALKNDKRTRAIRSIQMDLTKLKELKFSPQIFAKMSRLQFLEIYSAFHHDNSLAEKGLGYLETELRYFCWYSYSLESLPEKFSVEKLVILRLPFSGMKKLWDGVKNLVNLKELDLNSSRMLKKLPDLSKATNLEMLILWGCSQLTELHPSIFSLAKLKKLDLWNCRSLTKVARYYYHLRGNRYLTHDDCKNLRELSQILTSSYEDSLHVTVSDLERLPSCFDNLTQLLHLVVSNCTKLQTIPELPQYLKTFYVRDCNSLESLPELPLSLETLAVMQCTLLKTLSEFPPSLKTLDVRNCNSLESLPELPLSLETLAVEQGTLLKTLSEFPSSLKTLHVRNCNSLESLPELPLFLETLAVEQCNLLKTLSKFPPSLKTLAVPYCKSLQTLPELPQHIETLNVQYCKSLLTLPELPSSLKTLKVQYCDSLQTLPKFPMFIETLNFEHCTSLQSLAKLPRFLRALSVIGCESLQSLPKFPPSLEILYANSCKSLESLPEFPLSLKILDVSGCESLQSLPEFPPSLEALHANNCKSLKSLKVLSQSLKTPFVRGRESLWGRHEFPPSFNILLVKHYQSFRRRELSKVLETLDISGFESLQSLPEFLPSLETLSVTNCKSLESLPELPHVLKTLDVSGCESLQSLPEFPLSLETIKVRNCKSLERVPELPHFLKTLDFSGCDSLQSLPEFPPSLKILDVSGCESLQSLPELPPSLKTLRVKNSKSLKSLPELPPSLKVLDVNGCESLQRLPEFPPSLEILYVSGCESLKRLPELPPSLKILDVSGYESLQSLPKFPPSLATNCKSLYQSFLRFLNSRCQWL